MLRRFYEVEPGDTLWSIAKRFLGNGDAWPTLWDWNPAVRDPDLIYPGQLIRIEPA